MGISEAQRSYYLAAGILCKQYTKTYCNFSYSSFEYGQRAGVIFGVSTVLSYRTLLTCKRRSACTSPCQHPQAAVPLPSHADARCARAGRPAGCCPVPSAAEDEHRPRVTGRRPFPSPSDPVTPPTSQLSISSTSRQPQLLNCFVSKCSTSRSGLSAKTTKAAFREVLKIGMCPPKNRNVSSQRPDAA